MKKIQSNLQSLNYLFNTSGIVMYTYKLMSHYGMSDTPTIQDSASVFVLNNFNLFIIIVVTLRH